MKLNAGQLGVFRVAYAPELWARLAAAAAAPARPGGAPALAPADLAGLLDDAWALAEAGAAPIAAFLNLTRSAPMPCRPNLNPDPLRRASSQHVRSLMRRRCHRPPGHMPQAALSAVMTGPWAYIGAGVAADARLAALCGRRLPGSCAPAGAARTRRALGARTELEYAPWAVAAPQFLRVRRLLAGGGAPPGCAAAWAGYVRDNVTAAWVGGARLAQCAPAPAWRMYKENEFRRAMTDGERAAAARLWVLVAPAPAARDGPARGRRCPRLVYVPLPAKCLLS